MMLRLIMRYIEMLGRISFDKSSGWQTQPDVAAKQSEADEKGVYCAHCNVRLTGHESAFSFAGAHRHLFTNPAGIEFEIALYHIAQVVVQGTATEEHTWFRGYAWQVVNCVNCHTHLGWRFSRVDTPDFYGLITAQLIEK